MKDLEEHLPIDLRAEEVNTEVVELQPKQSNSFVASSNTSGPSLKEGSEHTERGLQYAGLGEIKDTLSWTPTLLQKHDAFQTLATSGFNLKKMAEPGRVNECLRWAVEHGRLPQAMVLLTGGTYHYSRLGVGRSVQIPPPTDLQLSQALNLAAWKGRVEIARMLIERSD